MAVEPVAAPLELRAQSAVEAKQSADGLNIEIRTRRQQHQVITRRAMSFQYGKRKRPEFVFRFKLADKGLGPSLEHLTAFGAHFHADYAGFERTAIAILPVTDEREGKPPEA